MRFNERGPQGLINGKAPGQQARLNDQQRAALAQAIERGPTPYLDGIVRWRLCDLAQWLWEEFRVSMSEQTLDSIDIYVTEIDKTRLQNLIMFEQGDAIVERAHEIERAVIVDPRQVAGDVVTMNSRIVLQLDDEQREVALVYPQEADERSGKLSVLSDVGAAILGYQEGDIIDWVVTNRTRRILIEKVICQPEAYGDFHL